MRAVEFVYIPDSVQDAGDWGKNLHLSEDWDSQVYLATEVENEKKRKRKTERKIKERYFEIQKDRWEKQRCSYNTLYL